MLQPAKTVDIKLANSVGTIQIRQTWTSEIVRGIVSVPKGKTSTSNILKEGTKKRGRHEN
jgi:hypothetical protein